MASDRINPVEEERRRAELAGEEPAFRSSPRLPTRAEAEAKCAKLNAGLRRSDVEWVVDLVGEIVLVERMETIRQRGERLAKDREEDRRKWKKHVGLAPDPAAPHWTDDPHED